ncbi:MAG TPA: CpaF family protein, partial [Abditibacterium sp.]
ERDVVARDVAERDVAERDVVAPEPTVDDRFVAAGLTPTRDAMSSAVPAATAPVEIPFMADSLPPDAADAAEELPDFLRGAPSSSATASPVASATETPTEPSRALERANLERASLERPMIERPITERPFGDRFAGRAALDREVQLADPLARAGESAAGASSEASRAPLVRIENEAAQSEREGKNRAAYRRKHLIFDSVLGSIDPRLLQSPTRDAVRPAIEKGVDGALREFNLTVESADRNWLVEEFLRETTDFGPLVSLLDDPGVNKILVTGSSDVAIEKLGRMERTGISFRDDDHLLSIIRRLAEVVGGRIDAKVPLLDRPLPDGARVRAKIPPMAPQPTLTLEKSSGNPFVVLKRQQIERGRGDNLPYAQLRERIQQRLVREFEGDSLGAGNQEKLRSQVEEMINAVILEERVMVTRAERAALVMDLLNEIVGLGPIEPLLNDPEVDEVMVNGPYQIYIERKGKLELSTQRFRDNAHVLQVIERIVAPLGRRVDEKTPMVDGRLRDGSRFNAIIPPLALSGPTMTIRKFARDPFTMTDLINFGTLTRESAQFLQAAVEGRLNIVVSGGTGSGKTTTLNVLSSFIPSTERIVTIEDAAELQLRQEHVIRLETRPPNIEGIGEVGIRELVRNSLRMRPDRIVVGECRGGEALDMLQAMNTGHDGSLTTGHSNGPRDMLKRLETMVMMAGFDLPVKAIREQISMAVHVIVHQERMRDGKRRITAVSELVGMEGDVITMQDIFRFEQERVDDEGRIIGALVPTGLRPKNFDTILDNGVELSMELFHPRVAESSSRSRFEGRMNGR